MTSIHPIKDPGDGRVQCSGCDKYVWQVIHSCRGEGKMFDNLGDRMKSYESDERLAKGAVIIRVDGKAFHTWTKKFQADKPFDTAIHSAMTYAMVETSKQMQGFKLAYTQSDEATFCLMNIEEKTDGWFDYKLQKLTSLTASMFTFYFNRYFDWEYTLPAFFDARAFNIPVEDAANNFVWRQQDWKRNSVQMLARAHFSHKEMLGKSKNVALDMLSELGVDWNELAPWEKYGTFYDGATINSTYLDYEAINKILEKERVNATNEE